MEDKILIADLYKENVQLKAQINSMMESINKVVNSLVCIGGPLNDNMLEFNKEQCKYLHTNILNVLDYYSDQTE